MLDDAAVRKVEDFIADATDKGGYFVQREKCHKLGGNYFEPTIITGDVGRVFRLNDELEYGLIGIISGLIATVEVPFGGLKESGLGSEGGSQGLDDYLETKYVCTAGVRKHA
jgi:succinate-semialdehyde dehydrogenase/glutarate-semialdehyde dehydrogenase